MALRLYQEENIKKIRKMIEENKYESIDPLSSNIDIISDFKKACNYGDLEMTKYLYETSLKSDQKINISDHLDHLFIWACVNDHFHIVKWLHKFCYNYTIKIRDVYSNEYKIIYNTLFSYNEDGIAFNLTQQKDYDFKTVKWILINQESKDLIKLDCKFAKEELENRKKSRISLILYLHSKKFKLLDIHAIALVWKEFL